MCNKWEYPLLFFFFFLFPPTPTPESIVPPKPLFSASWNSIPLSAYIFPYLFRKRDSPNFFLSSSKQSSSKNWVDGSEECLEVCQPSFYRRTIDVFRMIRERRGRQARGILACSFFSVSLWEVRSLAPRDHCGPVPIRKLFSRYDWVFNPVSPNLGLILNITSVQPMSGTGEAT